MFSISGGSDVLLSVVEYLGIVMHPGDFLASYRATSTILIALTLAASYVFVVRKNPALPDFWTKLSTMIVALSIPHFLIATVTIDQTLLFGAGLLFFLATYNLPWAGPVALQAFFSRPEAVIIILLYVLLFIIDRTRRRQIAINAASFIALLLVLKVWLGSLVPATVGGYQEYEFLDKLGWDYVVGLLSHIANIPIVFVTYAVEVLQSTTLVVLFVLGLAFSVRTRQAWPMYGVLASFFLAYAVLFADSKPLTYEQYISVIERMSAERTYFIVIAFNKYNALIGHGRYRLVLYPVIAYFMINAIVLGVGLHSRIATSLSMARFGRHIVTGCALLAAAAYMLGDLPTVAKAYDDNKQLANMHPVHKLGLGLKQKGPVGTLFLDNFCDPSQGSFLIELSAYSGFDRVLTRFCENAPIWTIDTLSRSSILKASDYRKAAPFNPSLLAMFTRATANEQELRDSVRTRRWEALATTYDPALLAMENITHVIAARKIQIQHLRVTDSVGGAFVHVVQQP